MKSFHLCLAIFWAGTQTLFGQTNYTVLPLGFNNQPGNSYYPLFGSGAGDFQQLFRASTLPMAGPMQITEVSFRVGSKLSSLSAVIPRVEIHLSTSSRSPEQMSTSWDLNKGPDERIVFAHDNVSLFATGNQLVNPFDLRFELDTPFVYDPRIGSLAMKVTTTLSSGDTETLDAVGYPLFDQSIPLASVFSDNRIPAAYGLITEFTWVSIPEPRVTSFLTGTICFVALSRYFRKRI